MRLVLILLLTAMFAGCMQSNDEYYGFDAEKEYRNPGVFAGEYRFGNIGSQVLESGLLMPDLPQTVRLLSTLDAYGEVSVTMEEDAQVDIVMAIWRPANFTEAMPVIVDAGPYYEIGSHCKVQGQNPCVQFVDDTIDYASQTSPFNIMNFVPHGYAVVQLAVRGTGTAGGCMDLLGPSEQHDLDQAITWLGEQNWTNGNIAMVGASYDGTTPWLVAATGNPYLKTIVPTAGLPDIYDLMFRNGSAETRGLVMHNQVYWGFGFSDDFPQKPGELPDESPWVDPIGNGQANGREDYQDKQNLLCPEVAEGSAVAGYSTTTGDRMDEASTYWVERDYRQRVLDNYKGSIFLIHGLQDWNVDPHAVIPYNQVLRDAGFEMKEWYGQWGHAFPDSNCAQATPAWVVLPCRLDYAETLLRWFDHYLKGNTTADLGPSVQVQDNIGFWRNLDEYPPKVTWNNMQISTDGALGGSSEGTVVMNPPINGQPMDIFELVSDPLEEELHLSGMPQLKLPFTVAGQGGQIAAWLFDQDDRGLVRAPSVGEFLVGNHTEWLPAGTPVIGHGQMNLRYYAGGEDQQALAPGVEYVAQVEMEPLDVRIPAGNRLVLWLFQYHFPDHSDATTPGQVTLNVDDRTVLRLPVQDVDPRTVFPVPGAQYLETTYVPEMYTGMPNMNTFPAVYSLQELINEG